MFLAQIFLWDFFEKKPTFFSKKDKFLLVETDILKYNRRAKEKKKFKAWDVRYSCFFEPTFTFMGFLYEQLDVRPKKFHLYEFHINERWKTEGWLRLPT